MNEPESANPFVSPQISEPMVATPPPADTAAQDDPLASDLANLPSRDSRFYAAIIDILIVNVPAMLLCTFALPIFTSLLTVGDVDGHVEFVLHEGMPMFVTAIVTTLFCYMLFQSYPLAKGGQTIGKSFLSMKTIRRDGKPAGYVRLVFVRFFPWLVIWYAQVFVMDIDPVGPLFLVRQFFSIPLADPLTIFFKERRCLHDYVAGTIVVKA